MNLWIAFALYVLIGVAFYHLKTLLFPHEPFNWLGKILIFPATVYHFIADIAKDEAGE